MPRLNLYLTALEDEWLTAQAEQDGVKRSTYVKGRVFPQTVPAIISNPVVASGGAVERLTLGPVDLPVELIPSLKIEVGVEEAPAQPRRPQPAPRPAFRPFSRDEQVKQ